MRILVVGLSREKGGIGSLLLNIAKCNRNMSEEKKVKFEFLVPKDSIYKPLLENEGCICYVCPRIRKVLKYVKFLKRLLHKTQYDFVWINNTSKVDIFLPLVVKKESNAKIIQHVHGTGIEAKHITKCIYTLLEKLYGKQYERMIDVSMACSISAANYFYKNTIKCKNCIVLSNGIFVDNYKFDLDKRKKIRSQLMIGEDKIILGAVGRLTAVKNYPYLLEIMTLLPEKYVCIILGNGEERNILESLVVNYKINDRVFLLGDMDNVNDYLSAMDILLMPSISEGMPFSLVEAQASGLTCVVSNGISKEANITGKVHFLDLDKIEKWVNTCKEITPSISDRKEDYKVIVTKGYDICDTFCSFVNMLERNLENEN